MGVYNPNAEMPNSCAECDSVYCDVIPYLEPIPDEYRTKRHPDCPLVEIKKPHGRLIDANRARCTYVNGGCFKSVHGFSYPIIEADTVIEEEK